MTVKEATFEYLSRLADTSLILGHRLSELCGHGAILENDIANTNIALDLIGQARYFYQYACEVEGQGRTEDDLAYLRGPDAFKNLLLVEIPNGHYGETIVRQFLFDVFNYLNLKELSSSKDEQIAGIARKAIKEVTYHLRFSSEWMIRLGDGTELSRQKMQDALNDIWMYTGELFLEDEVDTILIEAGIAPDLKKMKPFWDQKVNKILEEATLERPESGWSQKGGKQGRHTEHLSYLLTEFQSVKRQHPDAIW